MKKTFACAALAAALAALTSRAQQRDVVYGVPAMPPREALDRLNLTAAWSAQVQTESQRDGLATVQLDGRLLLVQTRSGLVTALDAETGQTRWHNRAGRPHQGVLPLAYNRKGVFAVNGTDLYAFDRETGALQWQLSLPDGVSAPPVAGDYQVYLGFGSSKIIAYLLPEVDLPAPGQTPAEIARYVSGEEQSAGYPKGTVAPGPVRAWEKMTYHRLEWAPVTGPTAVLYAAPEGDVFSVEKFPKDPRRPAELFHFHLADGPILAPPGIYDRTAYVGSKDSNLYAVDTESGRQIWRFTAGTPVTRQPVPTEKDVYVVAERIGLARIDRATGQAAWHLPRGGVTYPANPEADRFLAANPKFVYGSDNAGRLVVLDRGTGLRLSSYEGTRDFTVRLSNAVNDRIYLAANNGLVVCLHDREYRTPYYHTRLGEGSVDPRAAELEAKLAKPITDPGTEPGKLEVLLKTFLEKNGGLKYRFAEQAYQDAGVTGIQDRLVSIPAVKQVPLGAVLRRILAQVDSTYRVAEDTLVIYPVPKKARP